MSMPETRSHARRAFHSPWLALAAGVLLCAGVACTTIGAGDPGSTSSPGGASPVAASPQPSPVDPPGSPAALSPPPPIENQPEMEYPPFLGAAPTRDPASWFYVPGDYLLGSLRALDDTPALALTAPQKEQMAAVLSQIQAPAGQVVEAEIRLWAAVAAVLTAEQRKTFATQEDRILKVDLDVDELISQLKTRAGDAQVTPPQLGEYDQAGYPAVYLVAALTWLQGSGATAPTPAQAGQLLPFVQAWAERMQAQAALYPKVAAVLRPEQLDAVVATLERMRQDEMYALDQAVTLAEMSEFLSGRGAP